MVTRKGNPQSPRVERVRDAIAAFLRHIAEHSPCYYFALNGDFRHPFALAHRCGAFSQAQWRSLLVAADLATINKKTKRLEIKTKQFDLLIASYQLEEVERVERTEFDAWKAFNGTETKRTKYHVLRVGAKSPTSPKGITQQRDKCSGLISPPPNIPGLSAWQRTLRRVTEYDSLDAIAAGGDSPSRRRDAPSVRL